MDEWENLPDEETMKRMAQEYASVRVRQEIICGKQTQLPEYCARYAESCCYLQCRAEGLIRYYFEHAGGRSETLSALTAAATRSGAYLAAVFDRMFGVQAKDSGEVRSDISRSACKNSINECYVRMLGLLFRIEEVCSGSGKEEIRGIIERTLASAYMASLLV